MDDMNYKEKVSKLVIEAKEKGLIKTYSEFCKNDKLDEYQLSEEETEYYMNKIKTEKSQNKKYNIGDIVFVSNYIYKNGKFGKKHIFVIIDEEKAIEINYFGFFLSSKITKETYPYNERLSKNKINNLFKDSIVKCDDLIELHESEIRFKIGEVTQKDLNRFIDI